MTDGSAPGSLHLRLHLHDALHPAAAADLAVVDEGLEAFNQQAAPLHQVRALQVLARDDGPSGEGRVTGGAIGRTWGGCCELQQLWVHADWRRRGLGRALMQRFEAEARQRGCTLIYLTTFSFQAPGFYAALGFTPVLTVQGYAPGVEWFTMHKVLDTTLATTTGQVPDPGDAPAAR